MGYNLNASYGRIIAQAVTANTTGKTFYVYDSNTPNAPTLDNLFVPDLDGVVRTYSTIAGALAFCTADQGDVIFVAPNHTETVSSAGGITASVSGVKIIGLGEGNDRPRLTFSTSTAASMLISGANVTVQNIIGIAGINALTKPFDVTGNDCTLNIEWRDGSASVEAASTIRATSVSRLNVNLKYKGFAAGSAVVNPVQLNAVSDARINVDFYGKASTAIVNFVTGASTNVNVTGYFYNSGTALTKNIVDTITGSTWFATGFDGVGSYSFSGGSGAALAADDVSAVTATIGTITNTGGTATIGGVLGDVANVSIASRLTTIASDFNVPTADAVTNTLERDVVGNKTDALVSTVGTTNSLMAYIKGLVNAGEKQAVSATATMVNGNTIFTVTGDIQILGLVSECVTGNDATASTVQYQSAPTVGAAATFTGASASLANALAGANLSVLGTSLATAPNLVASGANLGMTSALFCPAGTIKLVVAVGSTTGTWKHYLRYRPLEAGATVS